MNFTVCPEVSVIPAGGPARRARGGLRPGLILFCWLGSLAVGVAPAQTNPRPAVPANTFSETAPKVDGFHHDEFQRIARENSEQFRLHVLLPSSAFESRPDEEVLGPPNRRMLAEGAQPLPTNGPVRFAWQIAGLLLGLGVWYLVARKIAPGIAEYLSAWFSAGGLQTAVSTEQLVMMLAEEKSVVEFQAALRAGSAVPEALAAGQSGAASVDGGHFETARELIRDLERLLQEAVRSVAPPAQRTCLLEALGKMALLKNLAKAPGLLPLWQLVCAMENLLKQITEKSGNVTSSTLRTAMQAITLLGDLCQPGLKADLLGEPPLRLLAVDDEMFSRFALANSLKRGLSEPDVAETGAAALELAGRHSYDLIVLDVQMPGMDGFELCSKIHETMPNRATPVVFVTSLRDFDARANSLLCGGRDLIAKPFLTFELTVKALTLIAGERLRGRSRLTDAMVEEARAAAAAASAPEPVIPVAESGAPTSVVDSKPEATAAAEPLPGNVPPRKEPATAFFAQALAQVGIVGELVARLQKALGAPVPEKLLPDLFQGVHLLTASAEGSGQQSIAVVSAALEGVLEKLMKNTAPVSAATAQTMSTAVQLIQDLCVGEFRADLAVTPPIRALMVDDDPVSLRAITSALQMRLAKPESASNGAAALGLAAEKAYDVIFLDVQMPDLDGFEVCKRVRETAVNRRTPVVFVTGADGADLRAKSAQCGGDDFLIKPCLGCELTLKALVFALRGRLATADEPVAPGPRRPEPPISFSRRAKRRFRRKH